MIELGMVILLTALIIGFSGMNRKDKIIYMLICWIIGVGMIIGNKFIPTIRTEEYYISKNFLEKPNVKFYRPMIVLKVTYDRPFTFIGDYEEYVIDLNDHVNNQKNRKSLQKTPKKKQPAKLPCPVKNI